MIIMQSLCTLWSRANNCRWNHVRKPVASLVICAALLLSISCLHIYLGHPWSVYVKHIILEPQISLARPSCGRCRLKISQVLLETRDSS